MAGLLTLTRSMCVSDPDAKEVHLYHIEGPIVAKAVEYMNYHLTKVCD